ncbi:hypothetical protein BJ508DRAFT_307308 [Ascobolus immersus RN42]|uniref:Uncharacterized protein n=1 Tax=Ascobolus immersus RN42 TaxID=1160509 RepID=A0A3N4IG89_ASCIM|nr:hypothetical protein BJ508DRAFT_307308 [Ascobolus immersus RN42]
MDQPPRPALAPTRTRSRQPRSTSRESQYTTILVSAPDIESTPVANISNSKEEAPPPYQYASRVLVPETTDTPEAPEALNAPNAPVSPDAPVQSTRHVQLDVDLEAGGHMYHVQRPKTWRKPTPLPGKLVSALGEEEDDEFVEVPIRDEPHPLQEEPEMKKWKKVLFWILSPIIVPFMALGFLLYKGWLWIWGVWTKWAGQYEL